MKTVKVTIEVPDDKYCRTFDHSERCDYHDFPDWCCIFGEECIEDEWGILKCVACLDGEDENK